jgi:hypothetical protein
MNISSMINVLRVTQRLVERNPNIDKTSNSFREFQQGMESLISSLEDIEPTPGEVLAMAPASYSLRIPRQGIKDDG